MMITMIKQLRQERADLPLVVKLVQLASPLALPKVRRDLLENKRGHLLVFLTDDTRSPM